MSIEPIEWGVFCDECDKEITTFILEEDAEKYINHNCMGDEYGVYCRACQVKIMEAIKAQKDDEDSIIPKLEKTDEQPVRTDDKQFQCYILTPHFMTYKSEHKGWTVIHRRSGMNSIDFDFLSHALRMAEWMESQPVNWDQGSRGEFKPSEFPPGFGKKVREQGNKIRSGE